VKVPAALRSTPRFDLVLVAFLVVAFVELAVVRVAVVRLALVGLDAATGGSSHVTHAVGRGPNALLSDLGHRLHLSWRGIVNKRDHLEIAIVSLAALIVLALLRPRSATLDALLVALAVSLLVNDSGFDVLRFGALVAIAVFTVSRLTAHARRPGGTARSIGAPARRLRL
jgi:hypothetical protein